MKAIIYSLNSKRILALLTKKLVGKLPEYTQVDTKRLPTGTQIRNHGNYMEISIQHCIMPYLFFKQDQFPYDYDWISQKRNETFKIGVKEYIFWDLVSDKDKILMDSFFKKMS